MENKEYCSPEEEQSWGSNNEKPNYETAEEYNQARREQTEEQGPSNAYGAYNNGNYAYGNNTYGNNTYGSNAYGNYGYDNNAYNQQRYANLGGVMVDEQGKPLKNRFALKLTLSIIMILFCCCSMSPLVMVLGIIGLIFTCLANSSYNAGNPVQFRSRARVSAILLWVGGGIMALIMLIYIAFFVYFNAVLKESLGEEVYNQMWTEEFWEEVLEELENMEDENYWDENYWEEDYWNSEDYWNDPEYWDDILGTEEFSSETEALPGYNPEITEETLGDGLTPLAVGFHEFTWNGAAYSVPMTYGEFLGMGVVLTDFVETEEFLAGEYEVYEFVTDDGYAGIARVSNNSSTTLTAGECQVDYFCVYNPDAYDRVTGADITDMDITILGGLNLNCTYTDLESQLGTPTYVYKEVDETYGTFETYRWIYEGLEEVQLMEASFYNGKICDIAIDHYGI